MNKLTRILTMGGFGLLAALATGAGAANAAPANVQVSQPSASHIQWHNDQDVVGYYRTALACNVAGNYGERIGAWDEYRCSPERIGLRRGAWELQVASRSDWNHHGHGVPFRSIGGFPGQFRPMWPGQFGPGHPGPNMGHQGSGMGHSGPGMGHQHSGLGHPGRDFNQPGPIFGSPSDNHAGGGSNGYPHTTPTGTAPAGGGSNGYPHTTPTGTAPAGGGSNGYPHTTPTGTAPTGNGSTGNGSTGYHHHN